jgi:hypothetical protein
MDFFLLILTLPTSYANAFSYVCIASYTKFEQKAIRAPTTKK